MGILDELLAGGQRQKEYSDFVERYEQGHPSQGYSDQEVLKRYGEVSQAVPSDQYAQAAQEALRAVAGRASGVREDAAGPSRGAWLNAAGKGGGSSLPFLGAGRAPRCADPQQRPERALRWRPTADLLLGAGCV